jgi:hypothetical protein
MKWARKYVYLIPSLFYWKNTSGQNVSTPLTDSAVIGSVSLVPWMKQILIAELNSACFSASIKWFPGKKGCPPGGQIHLRSD